MDYRYKQLEQELSALSKIFSDLGIRLSEVAKEVTSQGVMPSEKLLEQISASRASFENCRTAIHGHAGSMLVSPLPKMAELVSITSIDSLLKAAALAEETKLTIEGERDKALEILARVLSITHRETTEFKPLQECHARVSELRSALSAVLWPHKHPESESIVAGKHPSNALLNFVENLDGLEDEKWMALETTITATYGKPLFVAASRGKLAVGAPSKPSVATPVQAKAPVVTAPEASKPVAAAERPKAPEKPAATPTPVPAAAPAVIMEKKVAPPPAPTAPSAAAPAAAVERKEVAQDRTQQKPAGPQAVTAPAPVTAVPPAPVVSTERKEVVERPQPVAAPAAPVAPAATVIPAPPAPAAPQAVASAVPAPPVVAAAPPAPAPVAAPPTHPAPVAAAPPAAPPRPPAPMPVAAQNGPAPVPATPAPSAPPQHGAGSLSALATVTDADKRAPAPVEAIDRQRREPRLAAPVPQSVGKTEPVNGEFADEAEKAAAGDSSQRPQRWGFWRGNRT
jgi:hypothetical protein